VLITLVLYKVVIIAVGLAARGRNRDGADYFLAGRSLGPLVAAISASASSSSAWTLLGVSGFAYSEGVSAVWLFPACVGGFALNWYILAPALRRYAGAEHALTVTEVLAGGHATAARRAISGLGAFVVLVFMTAYIASQFQGAGKTFSTTFALPLWESVLIGAAVVAFYTLLGGFWAVSVTDTIQGLVMALTAVVLPATALRAVGGPAGLFAGMGALDQADFLDPLGSAGLASGAGFVIGLLGIGLGYPGQPHVVNRFMALRPGQPELVRARRIAMGWAAIVYSGMILLGWSGRVLFPALGDAEVVFITVAHELCHPILAGVMLAAVLSAIMSTADSQLLVAASALTHDMPRTRLRGAPLVTQSRLVVLALCVGATLAALWGPKEIFSPVLIAWAAMGATFGPVLLTTVLRGPMPPGRILCAMTFGLVFTIAGAWYRVHAATSWGAAAERVLPFVVALAICLAPVRARTH
jgi:sodium/proline symporter